MVYALAMDQPKPIPCSSFTRVCFWLYYSYAIAITMHGVVLAFIPSYRAVTEFMMPYQGWTAHTGYMGTLLFIRTGTINRIRTILGFMVVQLIVGIGDAGLAPPSPTGNPYLDHDPIRYGFTIVLPMVWIVLFIICWKREDKRMRSLVIAK